MPIHYWGQLPIHYKVSGNGPAVLMCHAQSVAGYYWNKVIQELEGEFTFFIPDLIDHGESASWSGPGSLRHVDNAAMLCDLVLANGRETIDIVGHSYGGAVAAQLLLERPQLIRRAVLIEPALPMILEGTEKEDLLTDFLTVSHEFRRHSLAGENEKAWKRFIDYRYGEGSWDNMSDDRRQKTLAGTDQALRVATATADNPFAARISARL